MSMWRRGCWGLGLAFLACVAADARAASDTNYQDAIVGERAAGMGGAFTALADEATGAYHNPAGIVRPGSTILQLSMSAFHLRRKQIEVLDLCGTKLTDDQNAFFSFPASFGFVKLVRTDDVEHAVALTLAVPHYQRASQAFSAPAVSCGPVSLGVAGSQLVVDRALWAGVSYAVRPWPRLRLGLSTGLSVRTVTYNTLVTQVVGAGGDTLPPGVELLNLDASIWSLFFQAGFIAEPLDGLRLGLSLTTPYITLTSSGRYDVIHANVDPAAWEQNVLKSLDDVKYRWKVPLRLALGLAYIRAGAFTVAVDVAIHAPQGRYDMVEHPLLERDEIPVNQRDMVVNANLGAEVWLGRRLALRAGGFTNFSSLPADLSSSLDRVHLFGFTLGGTYTSSDRSTLSFALQGQLGQGRNDKTVLTADPRQEIREEIVEVTSLDMTLMLNVGGSYDLR